MQLVETQVSGLVAERDELLLGGKDGRVEVSLWRGE